MCQNLSKAADRYQEGLGDMGGWFDAFRRAMPVRQARRAARAVSRSVGAAGTRPQLPALPRGAFGLPRHVAPSVADYTGRVAPSVADYTGRRGKTDVNALLAQSYPSTGGPLDDYTGRRARPAVGAALGRSVGSALGRSVASASGLHGMGDGIIDVGRDLLNVAQGKADNLEMALKVILGLSGIAAVTGLYQVFARR